MADLVNEEKAAIAPPVFVFQKEKAPKRSADGSSAEDGEDSDKEDLCYCPPVKRERTSSLTQFPPSHSVSKNNVFMPSSFCQSPTGNSDSEPEEKIVGFRLKPPTLIHGQAPSAGCVPGVPSQKPKEQQRSVLRPAMLQPPPPKAPAQPNSSSGTNGVSKASDILEEQPVPQNNRENSEPVAVETAASASGQQGEEASREGRGILDSRDSAVGSSFVFGQNIKERAKVDDSTAPSECKDGCQVSESQSGGTNYFLQYISAPSLQNAANSCDSGAKFVFGQNMSERVLSPPKSCDSSADEVGETPAVTTSQPSSQEATPEKANSVMESLEESAAAYTKATAKKCLLEKVEVVTGEESESNVLQIQCKLFVFDKTSQSWVERGRGLLRLNDMASTDDGTLQSRLVMRTQGSLRLILNTKLWAQMQIDKASEKSIRITAMDTEDQGVKVFLISASSKDTGQLSAALHHRILALRSRAEQEAETKATPPQAEVPQSNEEDSDEDNVIAPTSGSGPASGLSESGDPQHAGST
ncbi:ran-binding protein 3-like isoform X1 [Megalops cyprinoides]|uniref:ran-binding protein 3-like isoform X1 n=1 Tax=Megalops cyprinoides TaxID=118141 RepID=UPI00186512EC|nr:ran-binding protein 3-like isoform X1 [Megalops cyprinoides]